MGRLGSTCVMVRRVGNMVNSESEMESLISGGGVGVRLPTELSGDDEREDGAEESALESDERALSERMAAERWRGWWVWWEGVGGVGSSRKTREALGKMRARG